MNRRRFPPEREKLWEKRGVEVFIAPGGAFGLDLEKILGWLGRQEISSVLVEGGGCLATSFLEKRLADKVFLTISPKLMKMLATQPHEHEGRIWKAGQGTIQRDFQRSRKLLTKKLGDPELNKISMKAFRHWKATTEYHRTKDILFVQRLLGHKSLKNTLVYTHLVSFEEEDSFIVKVAKDVNECVQLLEQGFEYVTEMDEIKLFRKRK
jgi:hypothetical protein